MNDRTTYNAGTGQISFGQEVLRKATHLGALVIPASYHFFDLTKTEMLSVMVPAALLMIFLDIARLRQWSLWENFAAKIYGSIIRGHEKAGDFTGASYILTSFCLTIALYDRYIAIAAMAFIIVGDTMAALVGRKLGRHRFKDGKSIEGSLACLAGTLIVVWAVPGISLPVGVLGAVIATITEAKSFGIDDNVTVPILSGLVMTLSTKIISSI